MGGVDVINKFSCIYLYPVDGFPIAIAMEVPLRTLCAGGRSAHNLYTQQSVKITRKYITVVTKKESPKSDCHLHSKYLVGFL